MVVGSQATVYRIRKVEYSTAEGLWFRVDRVWEPKPQLSTDGLRLASCLEMVRQQLTAQYALLQLNFFLTPCALS